MFTYTGNEIARISKLFKKIDKNINISFKTNNKLNNTINNKIENFDVYDLKGKYKLTCVNCEKFYIGRINRNFKTRFKEHKKDFTYGKGHSNFFSEVIEEGHEMENIDNIITILHKENNHEKVNKLEEIEILKEAASLNILNDIINSRNNPLDKISLTVDN